MDESKDEAQIQPSKVRQNTAGRRAMFPKLVRPDEQASEERFLAAMKQVRAIVREDLVDQIVSRVEDVHIGGSIWPSEDGTGMEFIYSCTDESPPVIVTRTWAQLFCVSTKADALKVLADLKLFIDGRPDEDWQKEN